MNQFSFKVNFYAILPDNRVAEKPFRSLVIPDIREQVPAEVVKPNTKGHFVKESLETPREMITCYVRQALQYLKTRPAREKPVHSRAELRGVPVHQYRFMTGYYLIGADSPG